MENKVDNPKIYFDKLNISPAEIQAKLNLMEQNGVSPIVLCLLYLLFDSGSRISALLHLSPSDILPNGIVLIHQGKGSAVMRAPVRYGWQWLNECRKFGVSPFQHLNYIGIYRLLLKYNIVERHRFGINSAVTSLGRKSVAITMAERGEDIQTIADVLGHRSTTSTEYYLTKKPQKRKYSGGILSAQTTTLNNIQVCKNGVIRMRKR